MTKKSNIKTTTTSLPTRAVLLLFILALFVSVTIFQSQSQVGRILPYLGQTVVFPIAGSSNLQRRQYHCLPWEVNTDEWWTHHPDWEISLENDTHYCFSPIQNDEKAGIFRQLYRIGMSPDANCSNVITKRMVSSGWGADFLNIVDGLLHSLATEQPLQVWVPRLWHYAVLANGTNEACPRRDMFCYFLNLTHCAPNPQQLAPARLAGRNTSLHAKPNRWLVEYSTRPQTWLRRESYQYARDNLMVYRPDPNMALPINVSAVTTTWNDTNSTQQLAAVATIIKARVRKEPFPNVSCIPMHVRRADVVLHRKYSRKYHPISSYFDALWRVSNYHHPSYTNLTDEERPFILLMTDDANAIGEALVEYGQYPWMYLDRPRHRGAEGGWENQIPSGDPKKEVIAIHAVKRLIQQCKPPLVFSSSGFADYLRGLLEDLYPTYDDNTTPPLFINLNKFVADRSTLRGLHNTKTVTVSKNYFVLP